MRTMERKPDVHLDAPSRNNRFTNSLPVIVSATCLLSAIGGITYLLSDFDVAPKRHVETGQITVTIPGQPSQIVAARTRFVAERNGRSQVNSRQVQLPDGQWIDCEHDCKATLKGRL